jgi:hypothetical protein
MESSAPAMPITRKAIEYYTIELARLADGKLSVSITGTTVDEEEPQLLNQEIASQNVPTLDEALVLIKEGVLRTER